MTTIHLENGGTIGIYGDVVVRQSASGVTVDIQGNIAKVHPPHTMEKLRKTRAVSVNPDDLPGKVTVVSDHKAETKEYVQIPLDVPMTWLLPTEDAQLVE